MKLLAGIACVAALCISSVARADEPSAAPPVFSARLEAGFGTWVSRAPDTNVLQMRFTLAPEFSYRDRLRVAPFIRMTTTNIDLLQRDGMPFDASLSLPWEPSLGARVTVDMIRFWRLHLIATGEFEFPLGENRAWIGSFTPRGAISDVRVDIDTLRNHVTVGHQWRSVQGALRLQGDFFGWWHPYLDLGYMYIDSRLAVNFDAQATQLLATANAHPSRYYDSSTSSFYYMLGSEFDLGRGFGLRLNATVLPTSDRLFFAGEANLLIPFDFGLGRH
ncbi:MAG: hypothetical protein RL272_76 [Candidatus Parcubacteria bacterium]|jgi:hypothetical protein